MIKIVQDSYKHHVRYIGRFPVSQFNDSLGGVDLKGTQWVHLRSTQPKLYFPKIMEFSHYDEYGVTTFGSTESGLTRRSVPLSKPVRLRTVGPLQKLGWHEFGSLSDLTQSSQQLSHLDVTQPSKTVRFPSHYTQHYKKPCPFQPWY